MSKDNFQWTSKFGEQEKKSVTDPTICSQARTLSAPVSPLHLKLIQRRMNGWTAGLENIRVCIVELLLLCDVMEWKVRRRIQIKWPTCAAHSQSSTFWATPSREREREWVDRQAGHYKLSTLETIRWTTDGRMAQNPRTGTILRQKVPPHLPINRNVRVFIEFARQIRLGEWCLHKTNSSREFNINKSSRTVGWWEEEGIHFIGVWGWLELNGSSKWIECHSYRMYYEGLK